MRKLHLSKETICSLEFSRTKVQRVGRKEEFPPKMAAIVGGGGSAVICRLPNGGNSFAYCIGNTGPVPSYAAPCMIELYSEIEACVEMSQSVPVYSASVPIERPGPIPPPDIDRAAKADLVLGTVASAATALSGISPKET